jgi:ribonuclease R
MDDDFSKIAIKEAHKISFAETGNRKTVYGITIDDTSTKDMDDGFSIKKINKNFIIQVSISDVAEFINPKSYLFKEAYKRVETGYYKSYNIPMLPRVLSENKFSLCENQKTPAITFELILSENMEVSGFQFFESIFINQKKYSYKEVITAIKHKEDHIINLAYFIGQQLLQKRRGNGELAIYDLTKKIYTTEDGNIIPVDKMNYSEGYIIVQELMILVNKVLANFFAQKDFQILFRNHTIKNIAPDRNFIRDELENAIKTENLMIQVGQKMNLWFNRATYSPELLGHFALNSPAYGHFTSPIRRFADLINHIQIKNFIKNKKPCFNKKELHDISLHIDKVLIQQQEERKALFKEIAIEKTERLLGNKNYLEKKIVNANDADFKMLLKTSFSQKTPIPEIMNGISIRLQRKTLAPYHFYLLLFKEKKKPNIWKEKAHEIFEYIFQKQGLSVQILTILSQKHTPELNIQTEYLEKENYFLARIICVINNSIFSTKEYAFAKSKKESLNLASNNFLYDFYNNQLVLSENTKIPALPQNENQHFETNTEKQVALNNIHLQKQEFCKAQYIVAATNDNIPPVFECKATITYLNINYSVQSQAATKKTAKTQAANLLYDLIEKEIPGAFDITKKVKNINKSRFSILLEHCQKNNYEILETNYEETKEGFSCLLTINTGESKLTFTGKSASKKEAKHRAAKKALEELNAFNNSEI